MNEDKYLWRGVPAGVPCWHIHHGALLEWSNDPLDKRAKYIQRSKPIREQRTRLRLMRPAGKGKLPPALLQAGNAAWQRFRAWDNVARGPTTHEDSKYWTAFQLAFHHFQALCAAHADDINALHKAECPDCPWDGKTIFPRYEVT